VNTNSVKDPIWIETLIYTRDALAKLGVRMFLSDGTLLGAIRERDFIAHDTDIDVGVFAEEVEPHLINIVQELGNARFKKGSHGIKFNPLGRPRVDINFYYREATLRYHVVYVSKIGKKGKRRRHFYRYEYPDFGLITHDFLGAIFFVPDSPKEYLRLQYGDWEVKVKDWTYHSDPHNIKRLTK
jgi:phosphorylcholine metabolism protein LicD